MNTKSILKYPKVHNDQNNMLDAMIGPSDQKIKLYHDLMINIHSGYLGLKPCD